MRTVAGAEVFSDHDFDKQPDYYREGTEWFHDQLKSVKPVIWLTSHDI